MDGELGRAIVRATNLPGWRIPSGWDPKMIVRAEGSTFWDADGRAYLDFASQLVATNLGHGNPALVAAMSRQAGTLGFAAPGFATPPRARLSAALDAVLPDGLRRYFFSPSGTEANEAALKIARWATGRPKVLSRRSSYHGATPGSLAVTGEFRGSAGGPPTDPGGNTFAPDCYCYRCPLALEYPSCGVACATEVDRILEDDPEIGAMIVEPVVGTNGVIVPVPEYLGRLREITRRRGVLLIADEVMSGWGRTGRWFAVDHWGVRPDLLTTAKGITGGIIPLGLTSLTAPVYDRIADRYFPHGHTYEAHPVALETAVVAIGEYERLGLIEKSRTDGERLLRRLREMAEGHPSVGEVRGLGLFAAVELVRDPATREPMNRSEDVRAGRPTVAGAVAAAMMASGVFVLPWTSHLLLAPPLIIFPEELERGIAALDVALRIADAEVRPGAASTPA